MIESEIGRENFLNASNDDALAMLKDEAKHPRSYAHLQSFLENHGHRGYNEFDFYRKTWAFDASPVITTLQVS